MGYMCMLCIAYLRLGLYFALEEHSYINLLALFYVLYLLAGMITGFFLY